MRRRRRGYNYLGKVEIVSNSIRITRDYTNIRLKVVGEKKIGEGEL